MNTIRTPTMVISTIIAILSSMRHPCGVGQRTGNPGQQVHYGLAEAAVASALPYGQCL